MESREIIVMRLMAWQRAKGELQSVLHTYWDSELQSTYEKVEKAIETFIAELEGTIE